jgi:hypothetical protein
MFRAVVRDSLPTRLNRVVVINDAETPGGQSRVERVERLYRGFDVVIPSMVCDSGALKDACR